MPLPPLIGLNMSLGGDATPENAGRLHIALDYVDAVTGAGGVPLCLPPYEDHRQIRAILPLLKGFLLIGGDDYHPVHYHGHPQPEEELVHPRRDRFDIALARIILEETELPVLGICGGHQLLAIARGGALIQDIATEWRPGDRGGPLPHSRRDREGRGRGTASSGLRASTLGMPREAEQKPSVKTEASPEEGRQGSAAVLSTSHSQGKGKDFELHYVSFLPLSLAARVTGMSPGRRLAVNSFHHQAVHPERIGRGLIASAWSADGVIEAIEAAPDSPWAAIGRFVLGIQWHPERMLDRGPHRRIFRSFVREAAEMRRSS